MNPINHTKSQRNSNLEFLRSVCMFYIIIHHFIVHGMELYTVKFNLQNTQFYILNAFLIIAVNCFVLISGYYGIKDSWQKLIKLYLTCIFYYVCIFFCKLYTGGCHFNIKEFICSFMPFSYSQLWFIQVYVYLLLLSPILNKAIQHLSQKEYIKILVSLSILTFYFGYLFRGPINPNGYNIMNFIYLYFIGRYLYLYVDLTKYSPKTLQIISLSTYIISSLIIATIALGIGYLDINIKKIEQLAYPYNSPFVIISAISFFFLFKNMKIQNKTINWMASSSLAIYILQDNQYIRAYCTKSIIYLDTIIHNNILLIFTFILYALLIMLACILIDKVRIVLTQKAELEIYKLIEIGMRYFKSA